MPLITPPNRGFADYQRDVGFDSGTLWSVTNQAAPPDIASPALDVSRYAYLGGSIGMVAGQCQVDIRWYADSSHTIFISRRLFTMDTNIPYLTGLRLPNLGPFCLVALKTIAGAAFTATVYLFGTNRVHPLEFIPINPVVIDLESTNINAGLTNTQYPTDYYAGPAHVDFNAGAAGRVDFQYLTIAGVWQNWSSLSGTVGSDVLETIVCPVGAWRAVITNTSGVAANYALRITPSQTGAA